MWTWFLLGFLCAFVVAAAACYIKFTSLRKQVMYMKRKLDAQLQKRRNLVAPLSLTAAGLPELGTSFSYAFGQLPDKAAAADNLIRCSACEADLSKTLRELFTVAATQPQLQKDEYFRHLHEELVRAENRIQRAKRAYNSAVRDYNTLTGVVPLNILAGLLEFRPFEYFDFEKSL